MGVAGSGKEDGAGGGLVRRGHEHVGWGAGVGPLESTLSS